MNYLGIDVHKHESQVATLDGDGEVLEEVRVENANLDDIASQYEGAQAAIEATGNYYRIYDDLNEHLDLVVADPRQTKAIGIAEVKRSARRSCSAASPSWDDRPELRPIRGTP